MKKSKKLAIIIISMITITVTMIGVLINVFGERTAKYNNDKRQSLVLESQNGQSIGYNQMTNKYNNIYGLEYSEEIPENQNESLYNFKTKIEIEGNTATFYTYENGEWEYSNSVVATANNVLASILTDGESDGKTGVRFKDYETDEDATYTVGHKLLPDSNKKDTVSVYTDAQLALYNYWDEWVDTIEGDQYGLYVGQNNSMTADELDYAEKMVTQAETKANNNDYNVTIYALSSNNVTSNYKDIIVTEFEENSKVTAARQNPYCECGGHDNKVLDSLCYLGVNVDWLEKNNLLYTEASLASSFKTAGGQNKSYGSYPTYPADEYPNPLAPSNEQALGGSGKYEKRYGNVAAWVPYGGGQPTTGTYQLLDQWNAQSLGIDTDENGMPGGFLMNKAWKCTTFPTYYYFNYLPNVAGVDIDWLLYDKEPNSGKYFKEYPKSVNGSWGWYYSYATIEGWRAALDWASYDGKVERYSSKTVDGTAVTPDGSYNTSVVPTNVNSDTYKITSGEHSGKLIWDILSPGDVIIYSGTINDVSGDNSHMALYVGKGADGQHYLADMSSRVLPGHKNIDWSKGGVGFVLATEYSEKGNKPNTWYHFPSEEDKIENGEIKVVKTDASTGNKLAGAVFTATNKSTKAQYTIGPTNNNGEATSEKLPYGEYTVVETTFPEGYEASGETEWTVTVSSSTPTVTVYAKNQKYETEVSVTITKVWKDNGSSNRPDTIYIYLYDGDGNLVTTKANGDKITNPYEYKKRDYPNDKGTFTITGLPKYKNGNKINYRVVEGTVSGYTTIIKENPINQFTITNKIIQPEEVIITNKHDFETTKVKVIKKWEDKGNENKRPTSIKMTLCDKNGNKITTDASGNKINPIEMTSSNALANDSYTWEYTFENLYKYKNSGTLIEYTVQETIDTDEYTTSEPTIQKNVDGYACIVTITNTYDGEPAPEYTKIKVTKKWNDEGNSSNRPTSISIAVGKWINGALEPIYNSDGNMIGVNLNATEHKKSDYEWEYTFENLPVYDENGEKINYGIWEGEVTGYQSNVPTKLSGNAKSGFTITITNTPDDEPSPEYTKIKVTKKWNDKGNSSNRPASISVAVGKWVNGELVPIYNSYGNMIGVNLNATEHKKSDYEWEYTFENLPIKDENGNEISYGIWEGEVTGYESNVPTKLSGNAEDGFTITITNTPTQEETTEVGITKIWSDGNNTSQRPTSITIQLYQSVNGGTEVPAKDKNGNNITLTLYKTDFSGNKWNGTITDLPKTDSNGNTIKYSVKEVSVNGYKASTPVEKTTNQFEITNTLVKQIPVKKTWNNGGKTPEVNKIYARLDGEGITQTIELVSPNWSGTFVNIPKYNSNGKEIEYKITIIEDTISSKYILSENYSETAGYTIVNTAKTKITVEKEWIATANSTKPAVKVFVLANNKRLKDENGNEISAVLSSQSVPAWKYTFEKDFPMYDGSGNKINYGIEEEVPEGYECLVEHTESAENGHTYIFKLTNQELTNVKVKKEWDDDNNRDGIRPNSIKVVVYATNVQGIEEKSVILEGNKWNHTFEKLSKYKDGIEINYAIREEEVKNGDLEGYNPNEDIVENPENEFLITNTHTPITVNLQVTKQWDDWDDLDDLRPKSITVELYEYVEGGQKTKSKDENGNVRTLELKAPESAPFSNTWVGTFEGLHKYSDENKELIYEIGEPILPEGYTECKITYGETIIVNEVETKQATIINKHTPHYDGYTTIEGKVWIDNSQGKANEINGILGDEKDLPYEGVKVRLKYINNKGQSVLFTDNQELVSQYETTTDANGYYKILVNYDNSKNVYKLYEDIETVNKKLETAYIEFEYDGMKYTTVKPDADSNKSDKTSKAVEDEGMRNRFDNQYSKITIDSNPDNWTHAMIATTDKILSYGSTTNPESVPVKYCNGRRTEHTNQFGAWKEIITTNQSCGRCNKNTTHTREFDVEKTEIININLGVFEREQPEIEIMTDIDNVKVSINGLTYNYKYGVRKTLTNEEVYQQTYDMAIAKGMSVEEAMIYANTKVKYQNADGYTYRRPVNPADIKYAQENPSANLKVEVTYEVIVANLSTTLEMTVNSISSYYDKEYSLIALDGIAANVARINILNNDGTKTTEIRKTQISDDELMIIQPQREATILLTYDISNQAIQELLNEDATLSHAVEINSYSTKYGEKTLYAEQRTSERKGTPYAGYDYRSHPGNVIIPDNRLRANDDILSIINIEPDEDIAPSFVLCKDKPTTVQGSIWEDRDNNADDDERIGNGYQDDEENAIKNVKVELYSIDGNLARLYDEYGNPKDISLSTTLTSEDGIYTFDGLVSGLQYFIRYTYGNDTTEETAELEEVTQIITNDSPIEVNARNYKSTIITDDIIKVILEKDYSDFTEEEKNWPIRHTDGYSVAVDNMVDRLKIEDLKNSNFKKGENITAYTKPFINPIEFDNIDNSTESKVQVSENMEENGFIVSGEIEDAVKPENTKLLDKFDFGIIERPQEDLKVEKTINNFKIRLANGQVLTQGNPNTDPYIDYAKALGFKGSTENGKTLLVEMDTELMQEAQLDVEYSVKITNNNEIDYDYGEKEDYENAGILGDIKNEPGYADSYIAKNNIEEGLKTGYYYYGNWEGLNPLSAKIKFVDYLDGELVYKEDISKWEVKTAQELNRDGYIADIVKEEVENNGYMVLQSIEDLITIERTKSYEQTMYANKLLSNKDGEKTNGERDENAFDNHAEIIQIDAKTARTKKALEFYAPGNYEPAIQPGDPGYTENNEKDDDMVELIITPPTGIDSQTEQIILYTIPVLIGLTVIFIGIIFIRKKVLNK